MVRASFSLLGCWGGLASVVLSPSVGIRQDSGITITQNPSQKVTPPREEDQSAKERDAASPRPAGASERLEIEDVFPFDGIHLDLSNNSGPNDIVPSFSATRSLLATRDRADHFVPQKSLG